jgi:hypothetical protein
MNVDDVIDVKLINELTKISKAIKPHSKIIDHIFFLVDDIDLCIDEFFLEISYPEFHSHLTRILYYVCRMKASELKIPIDVKFIRSYIGLVIKQVLQEIIEKKYSVQDEFGDIGYVVHQLSHKTGCPEKFLYELVFTIKHLIEIDHRFVEQHLILEILSLNSAVYESFDLQSFWHCLGCTRSTYIKALIVCSYNLSSYISELKGVNVHYADDDNLECLLANPFSVILFHKINKQ